MIGPKGLQFSGFDGGHPGINSSQTIGPKRLQFSGFDGGHPGINSSR